MMKMMLSQKRKMKNIKMPAIVHCKHFKIQRVLFK